MLSEHSLSFFRAQDAVLLPDRTYLPYLRARIQQARTHIQVVQYIVNADPNQDPYGDVRFLAHALAEAAWRGLDVRIILSRFDVGSRHYDINLPAAHFLASRGVGIRRYVPREGSQRDDVHSKFALFDHRITVLGSHNWTFRAFNANRETSVAVVSEDVTLRLVRTFEGMWGGGDALAVPH